MKPLPDQSTLHKNFNYDPTTGVITRIAGHFKGKIAGCRLRDGLKVNLKGVAYKAHRLIWKYVHGADPLDVIDHINGNPFDNRLANLREATVAQNVWNAKTNHGITGIRGVYPSTKGKWRARICLDGKRIGLGTFSSIEEARQAYIKAEQSRGEYASSLRPK